MTMQRFATRVRLRPEKRAEYLEPHRAVRPLVTDAGSSRPYHEQAAAFGGTVRRVYSRRVHEEIRS
jgi:hypothetical protein